MLVLTLISGCRKDSPPDVAGEPLTYEEDFEADEMDFPLPTEPSSTPLPSPTPTPGADEVGSGVIHIWQKCVSEARGDSGEFQTQVVIPFKVFWNGKKGIWEAKGVDSRASGIVDLTTKAGNCWGMFTGLTRMTGIIIPPKTLIADPKGCKMVVHFDQSWGEVPYSCDNGIAFSEPASTWDLGPVTFKLIKGDEQKEALQKNLWYHTYRYKITKLELPWSTNCVIFEPETITR